MKKNGIRKLIAVIAVLCVTTVSLVSAASAGAVKDALGKMYDTAWDGLVTAGQAVYDTGVYLFTSDDAETAYNSTAKQAAKTASDAGELANNCEKAIEDGKNVVYGAQKMIEGYQELRESKTEEEKEKAVEKIKEGYRQADNEIVTDMMAYTSNGEIVAPAVKIVKAFGEYKAGYKDADEAKKDLDNATGELISGLASAATDKLAPGGFAGAAVKTAERIADKVIRGEDINPVEEAKDFVKDMLGI